MQHVPAIQPLLLLITSCNASVAPSIQRCQELKSAFRFVVLFNRTTWTSVLIFCSMKNKVSVEQTRLYQTLHETVSVKLCDVCIFTEYSCILCLRQTELFKIFLLQRDIFVSFRKLWRFLVTVNTVMWVWTMSTTWVCDDRPLSRWKITLKNSSWTSKVFVRIVFMPFINRCATHIPILRSVIIPNWERDTAVNLPAQMPFQPRPVVGGSLPTSDSPMCWKKKCTLSREGAALLGSGNTLARAGSCVFSQNDSPQWVVVRQASVELSNQIVQSTGFFSEWQSIFWDLD